MIDKTHDITNAVKTLRRFFVAVETLRRFIEKSFLFLFKIEQKRSPLKGLNALKAKSTTSVVLFLLFITTGASAQEQRNVIIEKDTASINRTLKYAYSLRENNVDSAGILYRLALDASTAAGYNNGKGESLMGIARYFNIKNEQRQAVDYLQRSFPYFENNQRGHQLYLRAILLMSEAYFYLGAYDSCSFYRYEALNYIDQNKIENDALRLSVYSKVLQYWLNAHEEIKHDENIRQIMQHINEMELQAIQKKDSNLLLNIYFQKEGYYHNVSQNDSARYYGLKNIEFCKRLKGTPSMIMAAYLNIALTYIDDKKPELAIDNIRKSFAEAPLQDRASNRYLIFGNIFLGEAYNMQGKYKEAIALVVPALEDAKRLNISSIFEHAYKTLADAYDGSGQYKEASENRKLYAIAKDSLMKTEKMQLSYNLEMKYRISEKNKELTEKELALVKNEVRIRNKNILIGCITAGLVLISIISLLILRNNRHKQKLQQEKITGLQQEMEIKTLKAMVKGSEKERSRIARDLHDGISGTIGSIRARVGSIFRKNTNNEVTQDFNEVMQLLEEASTEIRKTAHNLMPEILLQEGLVSATELYCQRISDSHQLPVQFSTYGQTIKLPSEVELNLYRTIQELTNNIIKHAHASKALVQLGYNESQLNITVEDNGRGMAPSNGSYGAGLKTMAERIHLLGGSMNIDSKEGEGTSVYIDIDTRNLNFV